MLSYLRNTKEKNIYICIVQTIVFFVKLPHVKMKSHPAMAFMTFFSRLATEKVTQRQHIASDLHNNRIAFALIAYLIQ